MFYRTQNSFVNGEISDKLLGRIDIEQYQKSVSVMQNNIVMPFGGAERRPGTKFCWEVKDSSVDTRIIPFTGPNAQGYVLEFGNNYIRIGKNGSLLGAPLEVVTTYTTAQLPDIKFCQSADTMWIVHPSHTPRRLVRVSDSSWTLTDEDFTVHPFAPVNATTTTLTTSGGGPYTITASAVTGINNGNGFQSGDVGRYLRIYDSGGAAWIVYKITAYTSTTVVTATVHSGSHAAVTTADWHVGKWSNYAGWPSCLTFHENRLCYAGAASYPYSVEFSATDAYNDFEIPSTLVDSSPCSYNILSDQPNDIKWLLSDGQALLLGTTVGEWAITGNGGKGTPIVPTEPISQNRNTTVGSNTGKALRIENSVLFVSKNARNLHECYYVYQSESWESPSLSLLAEHITRETTIVDITMQGTQNIVWCVLTDGTIAGMTYMKSQNVAAWHTHDVGGDCKYICTVPESDTDVTYVVVEREIDGSTVKYVECIGAAFDGADIEDAFYADCGYTYSGVSTTTIIGVDHLEGESVVVLAGGLVVTGKTVTGGEITLSVAAEKVHVGLAFESKIVTLPPEITDTGNGGSLGRKKTIGNVIVKLFKSLGGEVGIYEGNSTELTFNEALILGEPNTLFTGDKEVAMPGGHRGDPKIVIKTSQPLPVNVLALNVDFEVTQR